MQFEIITVIINGMSIVDIIFIRLEYDHQTLSWFTSVAVTYDTTAYGIICSSTFILD
jgi:hypothetical protein